MRNSRKARLDGKTNLHPLSLEEALGAALKVPPETQKKRRGRRPKEEESFERVTELVIDAYEEAIRELEKH